MASRARGLIRVHGIKGKGLNPDGQSNLLFFLKLLLGLGNFFSCISTISSRLLLLRVCLLLSLKHLLSLSFCLLGLLLFLFSFNGFLFSFLFFQFFLLFPLLLVQLLFLLSPDLLPLGLLLLQLLELILLCCPGLPPC